MVSPSAVLSIPANEWLGTVFGAPKMSEYHRACGGRLISFHEGMIISRSPVTAIVRKAIQMKRRKNTYADYVEHPRFGRGPRITGLNPQAEFERAFIHWHSPPGCRIPDTAIVAHAARQKEPTVAVTHYYDVKRRCRDCNRMFIFFAEEQLHWYEVLRFGLDSDCVRCVDCRKSDQHTAHLRQRYESLLDRPDRTNEETLELIDCALTLVENSAFGHRTLQRIRALWNSIPSESRIRRHATFRGIANRVDTLTEGAPIQPIQPSCEVGRNEVDLGSSPQADR